MEIGKLKEVDIRDLWKHEQYDFSAWLAEKENIESLNEVLGLTLTDISKEEYVGSFRCDLFAKDESTGTKVIIENQLEPSNFEHLGKIITYASGLDAKVIVWIVKQNFFLIELHAYKIGDSKPAPQFQIVEKPNDFIKFSKNKTNSDSLNKSQSERLEFWNRFNDKLIEKGKPFNVRKATTDHWYDIAIGTSEAHIAIDLVNKDSMIVIELYINDNKEIFDKLYENREEIEEKFGHKLIWDKLENKKASRIKYYIKGLNFDNHSNYDELIDESIETAIKMRDIFKKLI